MSVAIATSTSGATAMTHKQQVVALLKSIETGDSRVDRRAGYFDGARSVQHNPHIGDNLSGLAAALEAMAATGITMKYDRIHKVPGEGNFVLVVSEGSFAGAATSFYDLFMVENGKIAEHWDTTEAIPDRSAWKNDNGKFGF
jgi:predicted SnoaL-like aldol condensation-catalyzing enzyme